MMAGNNIRGNVQSQTETGKHFTIIYVRPEETVKNFIQVFFGNANAKILYAHLHIILIFADVDYYFIAGTYHPGR